MLDASSEPEDRRMGGGATVNHRPPLALEGALPVWGQPARPGKNPRPSPAGTTTPQAHTLLPGLPAAFPLPRPSQNLPGSVPHTWALVGVGQGRLLLPAGPDQKHVRMESDTAGTPISRAGDITSPHAEGQSRPQDPQGAGAIQRPRETEGPAWQKRQGSQHSKQAAPRYSITHSVNRELTFTELMTDIITI